MVSQLLFWFDMDHDMLEAIITDRFLTLDEKVDYIIDNTREGAE